MPIGVPADTFAKLAAVSSRPNTRPVVDTVVATVVAVVGATASGKTALALDLAEHLGGEIVNTDSMQVYRGMDIGTAKLPQAERRGIPHHLMDVLEVTEPATVAEFQGWAREVIEDCFRRQVTPVLVGGSALYTRAILDRFEFPGTDPGVRARLEEELATVGAEALHDRLAELDPAAAAQVGPSNGRRVVRALEVIEITGRPFSASLPEPIYHYDRAVQIGVDIDRETLDRRIEQRVDDMWAAGLRRRGPDAGGQGPARGAYGEPGARLPAGPGTPRRRAQRGGGQGADGLAHPQVRAPPGQLVPQGPAHHLGAVRRPGAHRRRRWTRSL